jgi:hypothetical protein
VSLNTPGVANLAKEWPFPLFLPIGNFLWNLMSNRHEDPGFALIMGEVRTILGRFIAGCMTRFEYWEVAYGLLIRYSFVGVGFHPDSAWYVKIAPKWG